jgi:O-antigen/teichoic acid export membrane protein
MLSRVLGLVYIFPFHALVGDDGADLYAYAYVLYSVFLSVATLGVPLAVSKFVAKYNALGEYSVGRKLFRSGILVMSITGVVSFLTLYLLAPYLAPLILGGKEVTHSYEDITYVVRMVSFALLLVPIMSLIRGFFQGHESMGPTAISQVVEQLVRVVFLLGSLYVVLRVLNGEMSVAIGFATFAAFTGAAGGLAVLVWYWFRRKKHLDTLLEKDPASVDISYKKMYKELVSYAMPFVFVGLAMPLYQLIDTFSFNSAMAMAGYAEISNAAFGIINNYGQKLIMIPITLATAFALSLLPAVTKSFINKEHDVLQRQLSKTLQILIYLTVPACIGLSILGGPAYAAFFSYSELGGYLLTWYAPTAIPLALFTVTASVLQGIDRQKYTVVGLAAGIGLKLILNYPLILLMGAEGSIVATGIGYTVSVVINLWAIKKFTGFDYTMVLRRSMLMIIFNIAMIVGVIAVLYFLQGFVPYSDGRLQAIIVVGVSAIVGAGIYFFLSYRSNLLMYLFGNRFSFLNRKVSEE